ncbi:MAG: OsmC family protein [Streptosporangiaceae bacterium]
MPAAEASATSSVSAVWEGDLRCRVSAGSSEVMVDAAGNGDESAGPSPTDYLLVSLASCYATALAWEGRKRGIELPDLSVTATGTYEGLRFGHLQLTVTTRLPADRLDRLLEPALRICYVSNTISGSTTIDVTAT